MAQLINEAKRMQYLAGIINESQLNEEDIMEEGLKDWILAGLITLSTLGGVKVYQMDKEAETDRKAQTEYYDNILSKALGKMSDEQKTELGDKINDKTRDMLLTLDTKITPIQFAKFLGDYAEDYVKAHPNEFSVSAKDGTIQWKYQDAASYNQ
jgi:hypothetical protein